MADVGVARQAIVGFSFRLALVDDHLHVASWGLATTIAQFKTPSVRDGEDSQPYFHNGSKPKFNDVVEFYIKSSQLARAGKLRNAPLEFRGMSLSEDDVTALVAFLRALTEDYDDA